MPTIDRCGGLLDIDLDALAANYRQLHDHAAPAVCAGVIKADAYGLGIAEVAPVLWAQGCREFFIANLDEAIRLRQVLPEATIAVLNGLFAGTEEDYSAHNLRPVLADLGQLERWSALARIRPDTTPAALLQVDTGMNRLGLPAAEIARLTAEPERLAGVPLAYLISHLACADDPDDPLNEQQLCGLAEIARCLAQQNPILGQQRLSLANSSGIFLGRPYHHQLVRPGIALYGCNPTPYKENPMREVVQLKARIVQLKSVPAGQSVGYGATFRTASNALIATLAVGYADGYPRILGNTGFAAYRGLRMPIAGRVSMDLITVDLSAAQNQLGDQAPPPAVGDWVSLIGGGVDIDDLAAQAKTISYELLTSLGRRFHRRYHSSGAATA